MSEMPFSSKFTITSPYGNRLDPITGNPGWHGGVDLVSADTNVRSVMSGFVLISRIVIDHSNDTWEWGNYISIAGDDGKVVYYCHLLRRDVQQGARVDAGQVIGIEGATGRVTGRHLHFEVRDWSGKQLDPCSYLGIANEAGYVWTPEAPHLKQAHTWSRDAVDWCVSRGILKGRGDGDYALGEPLTREEMCVMLYRYKEMI